MKFSSERAFQFWSYSVSHAQLLLRSPAGGTYTTNVDLAFVGVERVATVMGFDGLEVTEVESAVLEGGVRRFRLVSGGNVVGEIDAADVRVTENGLDRSETDLPNFTVHSVTDRGSRGTGSS